mmetsp:Transcript_3199/g.6034  ORF Transcript_3199/g.6034 Transcript_3199/m.6034 type:complete len:974 (-) Transcript_3199:151-3072(-)
MAGNFKQKKLIDLIRLGLVPVGAEIVLRWHDQTFYGIVQSNGEIIRDGVRYQSPSGFALQILKEQGSDRTSAHGWRSVFYKGQSLFNIWNKGFNVNYSRSDKRKRMDDLGLFSKRGKRAKMHKAGRWFLPCPIPKKIVLPVLPSPRSQHGMRKRVVVIGAGMSGLSCARALQQSGRFEVVVLEARSRTGGRVWTDAVTQHTAPVDLGGSVIYDVCVTDSETHENLLFDYCKAHQLEFVPTSPELELWYARSIPHEISAPATAQVNTPRSMGGPPTFSSTGTGENLSFTPAAKLPLLLEVQALPPGSAAQASTSSSTSSSTASSTMESYPSSNSASSSSFLSIPPAATPQPLSSPSLSSSLPIFRPLPSYLFNPGQIAVESFSLPSSSSLTVDHNFVQSQFLPACPSCLLPETQFTFAPKLFSKKKMFRIFNLMKKLLMIFQDLLFPQSSEIEGGIVGRNNSSRTITVLPMFPFDASLLSVLPSAFAALAQKLHAKKCAPLNHQEFSTIVAILHWVVQTGSGLLSGAPIERLSMFYATPTIFSFLRHTQNCRSRNTTNNGTTTTTTTTTTNSSSSVTSSTAPTSVTGSVVKTDKSDKSEKSDTPTTTRLRSNSVNSTGSDSTESTNSESMSAAASLSLAQPAHPSSVLAGSRLSADAVIPQGCNRIMDQLAGTAFSSAAGSSEVAELDIRFETEVKSIECNQRTSSRPMHLCFTSSSSADQEIEADYCVVTLPLGVLKSDSVTFNPALSSEKRNAINTLEVGCVNKVALVFSVPFWPKHTHYFRPIFQPDITFFNNSAIAEQSTGAKSDKNSAVLTALIFPPFSFEMKNLDDATVIDHVTATLKQMFGSHYGPSSNLTDYKVACWLSDPFSRGSHSFVPPVAAPLFSTSQSGSASKYENAQNFASLCREALSKPEMSTTSGDGLRAPRLFFAGEACSVEAPNTLAGAFETGLTAATRIIFTDSGMNWEDEESPN